MFIKTEKRLETVFFLTNTAWDIEKKQLIKVLEQAGISCHDCNEETDLKLQAQGGSGGILITDCREAVGIAEEYGVVCIGLDRELSSFFEGAVLVCGSLDSLDAETLEEVFLHAKALPVTIAETERLILREIAENDIDELCRISRMEGMEYLMPEGKQAEDFFSRDNLEAYISAVYRFYGYGLWSVLKKDGTLIGCCGVQDCEEEDCLELQYMLSPEYWKQGYGTEMCHAALGFVFARTDTETVCVRCHPENQAAIALAAKLGCCFFQIKNI